ncbi:MAG: hypothetical protein OEZ68_05475 [Gammaproteobacteria bacterium]|nr:hypothetical protein [Gammaproteobacteria bacterium]MDH5800239.1 hypothetical protein [Gammaproteobacteria bacterium]
MAMKNNPKDGAQFCCINTDFHQGGIIDKSGKEIPITEKMLQLAFEKYINAWESWKNQTCKPR